MTARTCPQCLQRIRRVSPETEARMHALRPGEIRAFARAHNLDRRTVQKYRARRALTENTDAR